MYKEVYDLIYGLKLSYHQVITLIEDTLDIRDIFYSVVDYHEISRCSNCNCLCDNLDPQEELCEDCADAFYNAEEE